MIYLKIELIYKLINLIFINNINSQKLNQPKKYLNKYIIENKKC